MCSFHPPTGEKPTFFGFEERAILYKAQPFEQFSGITVYLVGSQNSSMTYINEVREDMTPPILSALNNCSCGVQPTKRIRFLQSIASSKRSSIQTTVSQLELGLLLMISINTTASPTFILSLQEI